MQKLLTTVIVAMATLTTGLAQAQAQVQVQPQPQAQEIETREPKSYRDAYHDAVQGEKPLLVLVTAQWCPPCQVMKSTTIPELLRKDSFSSFHYATVDLDKEESLARQLIGTRGLPQLIMFEQVEGKWIRRYLRGMQSVETVEAFVAQANSLRTANASDSIEGTIEK